MAQEKQPAPLREADAARYIGMSRGWLRKQRHLGERDQPPFIRIGAAVRYLPRDLDKWLDAHRVDLSVA